MKSRFLLLTCICCLFTEDCHAVMWFYDSLEIVFSGTQSNTPNVKWSRDEKVEVETESIVYTNGQAWLEKGGSFTTSPVGLGYSWRPTAGATVIVIIQPLPAAVAISTATNSLTLHHDVCVRYSPDCKHWSTWQALKETPGASTNGSIRFEGLVKVPDREQEIYRSLVLKYSTLNVPWQSDQEAAVKWILTSDPHFFEKNLPFAGYLQFLCKGDGFQPQPIHSFFAGVFYGLYVDHSIPRDKDASENRGGPWRFKGQ